MVLGRPKPDGTPYVNDDDNWEWLQADAAKAARFLGYIPFDQITDQRNAEPVIRDPGQRPGRGVPDDRARRQHPGGLGTGAAVDLEGFEGRQPYRLALVGEKSSLADILARSPTATTRTCSCRPARSATRRST